MQASSTCAKKRSFRMYNLRPEPLADLEEWLGHYRSLWEGRMNALHTEVTRGKRGARHDRRDASEHPHHGNAASRRR